MRILAIETSCDETAIAIVEFSGAKKTPGLRVLSHIILSQIPVHKKFGGVVPNLAKREHQKNLVPILLRALKEAGVLEKRKSDFLLPKISAILEREPELLARFKKDVLSLKPPAIDAIAVTYGPGLAPALWVGVNFAKALACLWEKPLIPINHMEGHLYSAILQRNPKHEIRNSKQIPNSKSKILNVFEFPAVALLVSGGHTELMLMRGHGKYKILGETLDDAAGEAFDKVARMLGLGYPGGPQISALAEISQTNAESKTADQRGRSIKEDLREKSPRISAMEFGPHASALRLPRPMINTKDYNFSFSGLKTAVLYLVRDLTKKNTLKKIRPLVAKEFQNAAVEVLVKKTIRAAKEYKVKTVLLGGGVSANKLLRQKLSYVCENELSNVKCRMSDISLSGDNALMIAIAAYFLAPTPKVFGHKGWGWKRVFADANARLS